MKDYILDWDSKGDIFVCFSLQEFYRKVALHNAYSGDKADTWLLSEFFLQEETYFCSPTVLVFMTATAAELI